MSTHVHTHQNLDPTEKARLGRRAQLLAAASVSYNAIEAIIAITAGIVAGSVALVGFGLDWSRSPAGSSSCGSSATSSPSPGNSRRFG